MKIWESAAHHVVLALTKNAFWAVSITILAVLLLSWPATWLSIDASPDSLLLENDPDLKFYREVHSEYGTDEFIIVAIDYAQSVLSPASINQIEDITQRFQQIKGISQVTNITNVPLVYQLLDRDKEDELEFVTLLSKGVDFDLARKEFQSNPLYERNLADENLRIAAFKIDFPENPEYQQLFDQRYALLEKRQANSLSRFEKSDFKNINRKLDQLRNKDSQKYKNVLSEVKNILIELDLTQNSYLSGTPLIATDMKRFVLQDIETFGVAALLFMILILLIIFHRPAWVVITIVCAFLNVAIVSGVIGLLGFNLTVVSSNYVAILLIFSLAIGIHVVIRYQEEEAQVSGDFDEDLSIAIQHISTPCLYMVVTSTIAFLSLLISDVKPVIVFGYIMVIGLCGAYIVSFTILPLLIHLLRPASRPAHKHYSHTVLDKFLHAVINNKWTVTILLSTLLVIALVGINKITVENRFIDYFKDTTTIHTGLLLIDQKLGGTVPIEVILDGPIEKVEEYIEEDSEFDDYLAELEESEGGFTTESYWYNKRGIDKISHIHTYLETLPQIGKVLSLSSTEHIFEFLAEEKELDDFQLSVIYSRLPENIKDILINPYLSKEGDQARIVARLKDSDRTLVRNDLINKINADLIDFADRYEVEIRLTGIGVLYNNVLQSLYRSQILTIGVVFISIFLVLAVLFKSIKYAFIAILPNVFTALVILGLMGLIGIPLNIMTITIAAITIGIGVDDAIHYIHRYKRELAAGKNAFESIWTSQVTVGKALWFTSITIASGFILLIFSNFTPSIYFGLFTCLAMLLSILATFTIVPLALSSFRRKSLVTNTGYQK